MTRAYFSNPNIRTLKTEKYMTNAVVKSVLVLNETDGSGTVDVTLTRGDLVDGSNPPYYEGIMTYGDQEIDVIDAHFSGGVNTDRVFLRITLGDRGNTFTGIATTQPNGGTSFQYVSQAISGNTLTLTYSEPPAGTTTGYTKMYFHTSMGVIDPDDEVDRDPN